MRLKENKLFVYRHTCLQVFPFLNKLVLHFFASFSSSSCGDRFLVRSPFLFPGVAYGVSHSSSSQSCQYYDNKDQFLIHVYTSGVSLLFLHHDKKYLYIKGSLYTADISERALNSYSTLGHNVLIVLIF